MIRLRSLRPTPSMVVAAAALFFALGGLAFANVRPGPKPHAYVPANMVAFFTRSTCPEGWEVYGKARGRYVVGVPKGGTLRGTDGTALGDLEDRPTGAHTHDLVGSGADVTLDVVGGQANSGNVYALQMGYGGPVPKSITPFAHLAGKTSDVAGAVPGTNAPYIQLLACFKK